MMENCKIDDCRQRELNADIAQLRTELDAARSALVDCYETIENDATKLATAMDAIGRIRRADNMTIVWHIADVALANSSSGKTEE